MPPILSVRRSDALSQERPAYILTSRVSSIITERSSSYLLYVFRLHRIDDSGAEEVLLPRLAVGSELLLVQSHELTILTGALAQADEVVAPYAIFVGILGISFAAIPLGEGEPGALSLVPAIEDHSNDSYAEGHSH